MRSQDPQVVLPPVLPAPTLLLAAVAALPALLVPGRVQPALLALHAVADTSHPLQALVAVSNVLRESTLRLIQCPASAAALGAILLRGVVHALYVQEERYLHL